MGKRKEVVNLLLYVNTNGKWSGTRKFSDIFDHITRESKEKTDRILLIGNIVF